MKKYNVSKSVSSLTLASLMVSTSVMAQLPAPDALADSLVDVQVQSKTGLGKSVGISVSNNGPVPLLPQVEIYSDKDPEVPVAFAVFADKQQPNNGYVLTTGDKVTAYWNVDAQAKIQTEEVEGKLRRRRDVQDAQVSASDASSSFPVYGMPVPAFSTMPNMMPTVPNMSGYGMPATYYNGANSVPGTYFPPNTSQGPIINIYNNNGTTGTTSGMNNPFGYGTSGYGAPLGYNPWASVNNNGFQQSSFPTGSNNMTFGNVPSGLMNTSQPYTYTDTFMGADVNQAVTNTNESAGANNPLGFLSGFFSNSNNDATTDETSSTDSGNKGLLGLRREHGIFGLRNHENGLFGLRRDNGIFVSRRNQDDSEQGGIIRAYVKGIIGAAAWEIVPTIPGVVISIIPVVGPPLSQAYFIAVNVSKSVLSTIGDINESFNISNKTASDASVNSKSSSILPGGSYTVKVSDIHGGMVAMKHFIIQ